MGTQETGENMIICCQNITTFKIIGIFTGGGGCTEGFHSTTYNFFLMTFFFFCLFQILRLFWSLKMLINNLWKFFFHISGKKKKEMSSEFLLSNPPPPHKPKIVNTPMFKIVGTYKYTLLLK